MEEEGEMERCAKEAKAEMKDEMSVGRKNGGKG
jgi:hypothetical protein